MDSEPGERSWQGNGTVLNQMKYGCGLEGRSSGRETGLVDGLQVVIVGSGGIPRIGYWAFGASQC